MDSYALIDNKLAKAQTDIGESSNLAQIAQTYSYSFDDYKKYDDYASKLSVLAQVAIDNSKRTYDVDIQAEIKLMKKEMDLKTNKYPSFWKIIKRDFSESNINYKLTCPMNYLYDLKLNKYRSNHSTIHINEFLNKDVFVRKKNTRACKKMEELIERYSLNLFKSKLEYEEIPKEQYLLLRSDFNSLITEIRKMSISKNYTDAVARLISWGFGYSNKHVYSKNTKNKLNKNRAILLKVLYVANPKVFLSCFVSKKC